jgi:hypothetical protein
MACSFLIAYAGSLRAHHRARRPALYSALLRHHKYLLQQKD